jgi:hypothetical protein
LPRRQRRHRPPSPARLHGCPISACSRSTRRELLSRRRLPWPLRARNRHLRPARACKARKRPHIRLCHRPARRARPAAGWCSLAALPAGRMPIGWRTPYRAGAFACRCPPPGREHAFFGACVRARRRIAPAQGAWRHGCGPWATAASCFRSGEGLASALFRALTLANAHLRVLGSALVQSAPFPAVLALAMVGSQRGHSRRNL